ncbi:hypothetical protein GPA19_17860 [Azoarcus indigens]|uniref:hypothetical protein n=1 Tax=Azoarcus indigens TaxID=29545 RepID=UPI00105F009D|nr:hypothetical protein [Azoarcus indigens]NMG66808.1 hypothetical protein [Azoarcus indigens]
MKIARSFMKSAEFLARQMALPLRDMYDQKAKPITLPAAARIREARRLLKQALRLIDRASSDGAGTASKILHEVAEPFFGRQDTKRIFCD